MLRATCHTEDCPAAGVPVDLDFLEADAPPPDVVICGSCSGTIQDVTA